MTVVGASSVMCIPYPVHGADPELTSLSGYDIFGAKYMCAMSKRIVVQKKKKKKGNVSMQYRRSRIS